MTLQEVSLRSADRQLRGTLFGSGTPPRRPALIFVHGLESSQSGYANRAASASRALKAVCLTFDLSGHGIDASNFAKYSLADHMEDVIAAYDYLVSSDLADPARVGICGASYGGYLAALLTSRRRVKRLLLRAPSLASDVQAEPARRDRQPSQLLQEREDYDSLAALARYPGPVLIVESANDEVIPHSHITAYMRASSTAQHQVIAGASHALTNPKWDSAFVEAIISWFRDL